MGILEGKVAIVTGASKGIGRAEAISLAKEGAAVTVVARTVEAVEELAREIQDQGGQALALQCDVTDKEQVARVVDATVAKFGGIDILVNNAMFMGWSFIPLEEWTDDLIRSCYETGPMGSWYFMVACFPHMKEKGGKIINTTTAAGYGAHLRTPVVGYAMAKEAVRALTRQAAAEWGQYNIKVNSISPSAATRAVLAMFPDEESQRKAAKEWGQPLERLGDEMKDAGRTVVFLAGPDSDFITGCTIPVDGGLAMVV